MLGRNAIILILATVSCNGFWWGTGDSREVDLQQQQQPIVKQVPVSYFRAYTYQPLTFTTQRAGGSESNNPYYSSYAQKYQMTNPFNNWPVKKIITHSSPSTTPSFQSSLSPLQSQSISQASSPSSLKSSHPGVGQLNPSQSIPQQNTNDYQMSHQHSSSYHQQAQQPQHQIAVSQIPTQPSYTSTHQQQSMPMMQQPESMPPQQPTQQQTQQPLIPSQSQMHTQPIQNNVPSPSMASSNANGNEYYAATIPSPTPLHYSQSSTYINPIGISTPFKQQLEYSYDPLQYYTNFSPYTIQHVQFVPCMCPVTLNMGTSTTSSSASSTSASSSPPISSQSSIASQQSPSVSPLSSELIATKRNDEILIGQPIQMISDSDINKHLSDEQQQQ